MTSRARVAELAGHLNALHGELAVLVGELHGLGGCGDLSAARWLGWRLGCGAGPAGAVAAVASRVEELAVTVGALQRGELSVDQAAGIARHAPTYADAEARGFAAGMTVAQLLRVCRATPTSTHLLGPSSSGGRRGSPCRWGSTRTARGTSAPVWTPTGGRWRTAPCATTTTA